jgi:hypothetical protein
VEVRLYGILGAPDDYVVGEPGVHRAANPFRLEIGIHYGVTDERPRVNASVGTAAAVHIDGTAGQLAEGAF